MDRKKAEFLRKILLWIIVAIFPLVWGIAATLADDNAKLTGLRISGPASVAGGSSTAYTATASFKDGTTRDVTSLAKWSDNSVVTTISGGVLSARAVKKKRSVIIVARYHSGRITKIARKTVTITVAPPAPVVSLTGVSISGPGTVAANSSASYTATASFSNGTTQNVTTAATWSDNSSYATMSSNGVITTTAPASDQAVTVSAVYTSGGITLSDAMQVTLTAAGSPPPSGAKSINSTSQNSATLPAAPVAEQSLVTLSGFNILAANDLGMHCGDLDHRVASILPPFNVLHAQAIQKGTSAANPEILTSADIDVVYSAASNPNDPALAATSSAPVYKTNFWDPNPAGGGASIAFDAYNPFYPPGVLNAFPLTGDIGLPTPDLAQLYPVTGTGVLVATQQMMPGVSAPYTANVPQSFTRFDTEFPFFVNFSFGYRQTGVNWFAAEGIPMAPYDDLGRPNAFPLMRVQAKTKNTSLTGTAGAVVASIDSVVPVSGETSCYGCHASSVDGGGGYAACIPGIDANCTAQGSPRSGTAFVVARAADDTSNLPAAVKREWATDTNILRLHDAKNSTNLQASTPVVCQTCHYTPALDLAHVGPLGPADANANGRNQRIHHSNSRVMHTYHAQFTDLFPNNMPVPTNSQRFNPVTAKPVINTFVLSTLNQSCYRCHPGQVTKCLRGAMYTGGLICQDCHGNMTQVGNDFSVNFSASTPFPAGADLTRRVPWANEPRCQSCHTGDAVSNVGLTDPNVIRSSEGIRLLQAYRTNDANATPIIATNKRFAENTSSNGNPALYRLSKGHSGIFCEGCHGSTHAEWPVPPESSASIPNDNMAATRLQGHTGTIMECTVCHAARSLPVSLGGPHGMHPVNDSGFVGGHEDIVSANRSQCQACHGRTGQGTVLSKVAATRTLGGRTLNAGYLVSCGTCHGNPL